MPTRNVVLTDHQAELVDRLVSGGRYQNASEVLRDGLRLVEREESESQARLAALREAARVGIADSDMEVGVSTATASSGRNWAVSMKKVTNKKARSTIGVMSSEGLLLGIFSFGMVRCVYG